MTGIVREIGRSFVVSCFLPAVVFVSLSRLFFFPIFFDNFEPLAFLAHTNFEQTIALIAVASAFIGYLLWSLNANLVKLFEGYYFQWLMWPGFKYHEWRRTRLLDKAERAREEYKRAEDEDLCEYWKEQFVSRRMELETRYPLVGDVMPTAIGNVFRAFEQYPGMRYGVDAVLFWPRLTSVVKPELGRVIEEANNSLTFLLTSSLMCTFFGIEVLVVIVKLHVFPVMRFPLLSSEDYIFYGIFAAGAFILAHCFKRCTLDASIAFGNLVKSCFDLFRRDLLEKMAGEGALADEQRAWTQLRRFILVDKRAWLSEWKKEEGERVQDKGRPTARSFLERVLVPALASVLLIKEMFCESRHVSIRSGSRDDRIVLTG